MDLKIPDSIGINMRILRRKSKKRYLGNKNVYEYDHLSICIPAKHHDAVEPFLGQDLDVDVRVEANSRIIIVLESKEKTRVNRKIRY